MMSNQFKTICLSVLLLTTIGLRGESRITEFHATRQGSAVLLEWATEYESGISKFEIQRSIDQSTWIKIGDQKASGESSSRQYYSFTDNSIFKTLEANFYYRLVIVDQAGKRSVYDVIASISGSSGIRHTWGSIKAMFR